MTNMNNIIPTTLDPRLNQELPLRDVDPRLNEKLLKGDISGKVLRALG